MTGMQNACQGRGRDQIFPDKAIIKAAPAAVRQNLQQIANIQIYTNTNSVYKYTNIHKYKECVQIYENTNTNSVYKYTNNTQIQRFCTNIQKYKYQQCAQRIEISKRCIRTAVGENLQQNAHFALPTKSPDCQ